MHPADLRHRTFRFALDIIGLFRQLPRTPDYQEVGRQMLRSANAVAANYRAACRGRSKAEFIAKLGVVREEADETEHWLQLLEQMGLEFAKLPRLLQECRELVAIFSAAYKTASRNRLGARSET